VTEKAPVITAWEAIKANQPSMIGPKARAIAWVPSCWERNSTVSRMTVRGHPAAYRSALAAATTPEPDTDR
jgi:hypothetical protein